MEFACFFLLMGISLIFSMEFDGMLRPQDPAAGGRLYLGSGAGWFAAAVFFFFFSKQVEASINFGGVLPKPYKKSG